jgi:hypothetical protein
MRRTFLSAAAVLCVSGLTARADDQAAARAILDAAIKAHGGEAALSKFVAAHFKGKGVQFGGGEKSPLKFEMFCQDDDKLRTLNFDEAGKVDSLNVLNGKHGWSKNADQPTTDMTEAQLRYSQDFSYINWATFFVPLKTPEYELEALSDTTVDDRPADCILVLHKNHSPLKLCFDKQTHLFVKYEHKTKDPDSGQEIHEECVFSDYRNVQGMKQPYRFVSFWDGAKTADVTLTEQTYYEKPLDAKLFEKP